MRDGWDGSKSWTGLRVDGNFFWRKRKIFLRCEAAWHSGNSQLCLSLAGTGAGFAAAFAAMPPITRRDALRLTTALAMTSFARAAEAEGGFDFIAVNDLHFSDEKCAPFFQNVVARMRESAPHAALCLISGDLADRGTPEQYAALRVCLDQLGVPVFAVPGNHDYQTDEDRAAYDAAWPGRSNYVHTHGGWQFIGLDSTQGMEFDGTVIGDATLAWCDENLPKLDARAPTVAFTHFPLGPGTVYHPRNADALLARLDKLNLRGTFSGHWHGLNEQHIHHADVVVNRCCARVRENRDGSPLKGWWVCRAAADGTLTRRFAALAAETAR